MTEPHFLTRSRHWWEASHSQLVMRCLQLEAELSCAAVLLELREDRAERQGEPRSDIVTGLQTQWRAMLAAKPELETETEIAT